MIIIFILVAVIDLTTSVTFDRTKGQSKPKYCKDPKGKKGDTYTEGCKKYTCKSGEWKEKDICAETELSSGKSCVPACPIITPFCKGICIGDGSYCIGQCYLFSADTRSCGVAAAQTSSDECNTECSDATDTCQNCLVEKLPDHCEDITYASCFFCTKSVLQAARHCLQNRTLACVKAHLSSSSCYSCICSIVCSVAGPDHVLCKACSDTSDDSIADFWGPIPGAIQGSSCPPTWAQSYETTDSKCYKVAPGSTPGSAAKVIWDQGPVSCQGIGGTLAIPDNAARHAAVSTAIIFAGSKDCWLSGTQVGTSDTWSWVPAAGNGNPFPVSSSDFGQEAGCIDFTRPTPSCLYADENGLACNDPCAKAKCVVCEMDPS